LALGVLATIAYLQGNDARAVALLEERVGLARVDARNVAFAVEVLSWVALRQGNLPTAAARLQHALALHWSLHYMPRVACCLEHAAALVAATDRGEVAARWLGAAAALREAFGRPLDLPHRPTYDRLVATLRARLGDASWAKAWDAGWAHDLAAAVAEADALMAEIATGAVAPIPAAPHGLTLREHEVLRLVVDGRSNQEIADALCISLRTAQTHVAHILTKLGVDSRTAAATLAVRESWL
jgi:DNA-binding CsgD family transcriptional regulator